METTLDYSHHRMNNFEWITLYTLDMGKEAFDSFLNRAFGRLMNMQPGDAFNISKKVQEKNRDLFVKVACYFIQCGNIDYTFSENYVRIHRCEASNINKPLKTKSK